jgi:hypothetical protein
MNLEILNGSISELTAPFWKEKIKTMMQKIIVKIKILIKFYELGKYSTCVQCMMGFLETAMQILCRFPIKGRVFLDNSLDYS